ncbi:Protein of unknown function [Gryllus bimaculatus]|nr:Protein of unknown function [Gryllus bimaculatus]
MSPLVKGHNDRNSSQKPLRLTAPPPAHTLELRTSRARFSGCVGRRSIWLCVLSPLRLRGVRRIRFELPSSKEKGNAAKVRRRTGQMIHCRFFPACPLAVILCPGREGRNYYFEVIHSGLKKERAGFEHATLIRDC